MDTFEALHALVQAAPLATMALDPEGRVQLWNSAAERLFGWSRQEVLGSAHPGVPADKTQEFAGWHRQVLSGEGFAQRETVRQRRDGSCFTAQVSWSPLWDGQGAVVGVSCQVSDLSSDPPASGLLRDGESRYRMLVDTIPHGIQENDLDGIITYSNSAHHAILGYPDGALIGKAIWDMLPRGDDPQILRAELARLVREQPEPTSYVTRNLTADGRLVDLQIDWAYERDVRGELTGFISVITDITERVQAEDRAKENERLFHHLAYHDALTGLPNRLLFQDRLNHAISKAKRTNAQVALMFLDLDRFKTINDTLGHSVGDDLLMEIASRLRASVRDADTVARLGGDEFLLIIEEVEDVRDVVRVAHHILRRLCQPCEIEGYQLYVTTSIGISLFPSNGNDVGTLMKSADVAMFRAKELGRNNYQFFNPEMNAHAEEQLQMENDLRRALERQEFVVHYQPQYDLVDNRLVGMESLLRWDHPRRGMVEPGEFIPLAEETGLIVPIGEWVLATSCAQIRTWQEAGLTLVPVSVNISGRQFKQPDFLEMVDRILAETGLNPTLLEIEITESVILENVEKTILTLNALKARGIKLAIDDFGTGYSSLSYLKRFPVSKLKIDRSFVRDVATNPSDATLAVSIINLARNLHLEVVAEGVETEPQNRFFRDKGCGQGQGHLYGHPVRADEMLGVLRRGKKD